MILCSIRKSALRLLRATSPFFFVLALYRSSWGQTGLDPGFDPDPVAIPEVAQTAPRPVTSMDLLKLRDIEGLQLSPDGKYVAFVLGQAVYKTNHYRSGMFVISTAKGSKPISLGTAGPARWMEVNEWLTENPVWSADSRYIFHTMKSNGAWQLWRWSLEGGAPVQISHTPQNVDSVALSPDSRSLVLTLETPSKVDRKKLYDDGILYDGFEVNGQSLIDRLVATPDGESETWIHDLASGSIHKASAEEQKALEISANAQVAPSQALEGGIFSKKEIEDQKIYAFEISPDRKKVAYWRFVDDSKGFYALLQRPVEGGSPVTLAHWPVYPGDFWWSADSRDLYFTEDRDNDPNDPRRTKIMVAPANGGPAHPVLETADFIRQFSTDRTKRLMACIRENDSTPSEIALADLSTGETRTLVETNPELQNLQVNRSRRIDVSDKRGQGFWGHLVLPLGYQAGKRYPLIITTYVDVGGFLRGGTGDEYPIHVFTANGFAVLNLDFLTFQLPKPGDPATTLLRWQAPMEAIEAMLEKLDGMGIVDRSRVAITGLSHGAEMVHYGVSHTNFFRAAIASGPSFDPISFYTYGDHSFLASLDLQSPEGDTHRNWQTISAALNAERIHAALLINAADSEYIDVLQLAVSLRELKKPFEMFIYPDERHTKNQPRHRYSIYERNVDWLNFWLRDKEDPSPAKAEQYKRWRELRKLQEHNPSNAGTN